MNKNFPALLIPEKVTESVKFSVSLEIEGNNGLVIPNITDQKSRERSLKKIMPSLIDVSRKVSKAKADGKHVLILPGSFDLVHKGHAHYVRKAVECYCKAAKCQRKELFVVVLADDDDLIRQVKSFKHKDFGGDEPQARPVERAPERALSLGSLPDVDIVGIIPSPSGDRSKLPKPPKYNTQEMLEDLKNNFYDYEKQRIASFDNEADEGDIITKILKDRDDLEKGVRAYIYMSKNWSSKKDLDNIPVQAWQLYVLGIVNGVSQGNKDFVDGFKPGSVTRIVNTEDTKYLGQVLFLMRYADINVALMKYKIEGSSTTELIKWALEEHKRMIESIPGPWDIIRQYKKQAIGENRSEAYMNAINEVEKIFRKREYIGS